MWWNQTGYAGQQPGFMGSNMAPMGKHGWGALGYGAQGQHMVGPGMAGSGMAGSMGGQPMGYMGTGYGYGLEGIVGNTLLTLITVLFWVLILVGVVFFVKGLWEYITSQRQAAAPVSSPANAAMEILRQRFAKGEISRQEFEERSQVLA